MRIFLKEILRFPGLYQLMLVFLLAGFLRLTLGLAVQNQHFYLSSPNDEVTIMISLKENQTPYPKGRRPYYQIRYKANTVLKDSGLGLELKEDSPLEKNFSLVSWDLSRIDERYVQPYGTHKVLHNFCHQGILRLRENGGYKRRLDLVFRAYDEGAAFRYVVPKQLGLEILELKEENSTFFYPAGYKVWAQQLPSYSSNYESEFNVQPLWRLQLGSIVGLPLLMETDKGDWLAITEASIIDYAGMYLTPTPGIPETLQSQLAPHPRYPRVKVKTTTPMRSPWRVFLLGPTPGSLIENNVLLLHLNEPSKIADTSWIRPGKSAWHWWSGTVAKGVEFKPGMNTATMKHYVDFAAEHRLEYFLIDSGWHEGTDQKGDITQSRPEIDMVDVISYAKKKGVGILLWLHWKRAQAQMEEAFKRYEKWGVAGVKVDFMDRDDQEMVQFYHRIASRAASHRLLVNFHGAYKPDGLRRTWPNIITREAVLGLEWNKFSSRCNPIHAVTLPFTRMLAGPMDYTPGAFRTVSQRDFQPRVREPLAQGTRCHQLAMYVVYESPLQMLADYPFAYQEESGIEFLKKVPTSWDDTQVIHGSVGEYITVARRSGRDWYVGSMTNWEPRKLIIPLSFLGSGDYFAEIYSDPEIAKTKKTGVSQKHIRVSSKDLITARLHSGGGHAMHIYPAQDGPDG